MSINHADASPVKGKTFSLFGRDRSPQGYYRAVARVADACLERQPDTILLIKESSRLGKRPRLARKLASRDDGSLASFIVRTARQVLSEYTTTAQDHLRELSLLRRFDGVLAFSEEQYHLAMLEIELTNRAFRRDFLRAKRRLAFLPHCLRDLEANCRAAMTDIDRTCRGCSANCFVHAVSALLRQHGIEPYLWMQADLKALFRRLRDDPGGLGVLGIACVPELVRGMRMCRNLGVPVVGIPLNANRCARWMGEFHPTSADLAALDALLASDRN